MENQTTQNPAQEPVPNPIPIPHLNNNRLIIIFSVILLILLASTAYLGYQNYQLRKQITALQSPSPTPTATANPTANWRTYTNNTYGYSINVPDYISQLAKGPDNQTTIVDADWIFAKTDVSMLDVLHKTIAPSGAINLELASYKDAAQQNYDLHCKGNLLSFNQESPTISNVSPIEGVEQYVQSYGTASHSTAPQVKYWDSKVCFIKNGVDYEIYYQNYESSNLDPTLSQILSSFKFSGQTSNIQAVNGLVTGIICYPSEKIPAGKIVAKNIATNKLTSFDNPEGTGTSNFSISLPEGSYKLRYETTNGTVGYYTSCTGSEPLCQNNQTRRNSIVVNVNSNQTIQGIKICDYYYTPGMEPDF